MYLKFDFFSVKLTVRNNLQTMSFPQLTTCRQLEHGCNPSVFSLFH